MIKLTNKGIKINNEQLCITSYKQANSGRCSVDYMYWHLEDYSDKRYNEESIIEANFDGWQVKLNYKIFLKMTFIQ